jgi:hypothetical protein
MKCDRNDVGVLDMTGPDQPYKIWSTDKYKCPGCGVEVIIGFGQAAIAEHFEAGFQAHVDYYEKQDGLVRCYDRPQVIDGQYKEVE